MTDEREQAWFAVHVLLPQGWRLTPEDYHGDERRWHVTGVDLRPRGRRAKHDTIEGIGQTEVEAVRDLVRKLAAKS